MKLVIVNGLPAQWEEEVAMSESACPECGSSDIIDIPNDVPPYDTPPAAKCSDCGYEDYPESFTTASKEKQ